jgi:aspartyl-tRNA synthetase
MGDLYIEMNYVADHPDLVKALDLSKITLKVHTGDIYVVNEQEDNTTRFESLARKKQEEEMSKKKKAKEAEEYDRTHGPYEMSQWKDKLIVIDGVFDETIKGKKAIVQEVDNLLGRIVVKTENEKEYYFRMSMGHLKEFKIISGKVVSSEEQPELV